MIVTTTITKERQQVLTYQPLADHPYVTRLFSALGKKAEGGWHRPTRILSRHIGAREWQDLNRSDSLTQHLALLIQCSAQVTLRYSGVGKLFQHEAASLGTTHGFVREVVLHPPIGALNGQLSDALSNALTNTQAGTGARIPLLLCARTVCRMNTPLLVKMLRQLKTRSLGKTLFRHGPPPFYARQIAHISGTIHARKSIFKINNQPLLVTEIPLWNNPLWVKIRLNNEIGRLI